MKKAFIDQILLGLFLFATIIVIGATISDNMEARDKYYNLKKITDNAVLTLAKYYVNVEENTSSAQNVHQEMLIQTKLGNCKKRMNLATNNGNTWSDKTVLFGH